MKISFFLFHFVLFVICVLTFLSGCSTIEGTRVEVQTGSPDVWKANPSQSVSVKVVRTL